MKKQKVNWGQLIGRLLQNSVGGFEGGFRVDENGRLVEDYLETDGAQDAAAYLAQLASAGELPQAEDADILSADDLSADDFSTDNLSADDLSANDFSVFE